MTGLVRVTSTEALAFQVVAPAVASLRQAHPGLQVDLTVGVRSLDIARRDADLAVRFARPSTSDLVCRKLGEVGYSLYASERYSRNRILRARPGVGRLRFGHLHRCAAGDEPILHGESLDGARIALRCDNPLIQLRAAANDVGIAELTCFLGDFLPDLIRVWPHEAPARRTAWLIMHSTDAPLSSDPGRRGRNRVRVSLSAQDFAGRDPGRSAANAVSLGQEWRFLGRQPGRCSPPKYQYRRNATQAQMDLIMPNGDAPIATSQIGQAAQAVVYVPKTRGKDIVQPRYLVIAPCRRGPYFTIRPTAGVDPNRTSRPAVLDSPQTRGILFSTEACLIALSCELPPLPAQECMTTLYPR